MDQEWLQKNVGEALSSALGSLVMTMPEDPIEFIALWILRFVQNEQRRLTEQEERDEIARQLAEYHRMKTEEEARRQRELAAKEAAETAQRQREEDERAERLRQYQEIEAQRQREIEDQLLAEQQLRDEKRKQWEAADEEGRKAMLEEGFTEPPPEDPLAKYAKRHELRLRDLDTLDKSFFDEIRRYKTPPPIVYKVLKAMFLILGKPAKELDEWTKIRAATTSAMLEKLRSFNPAQKLRPKRFKLCGQVLRDMSSEAVNHASHPVFLIYQWIVATLDLRVVYVRQKKMEAEKNPAVQIDPDDTEAGVAAGAVEGMEKPQEDPISADGELVDGGDEGMGST